MGPTVTLTFKGDEKDAVQAIENVGDAMEQMAEDVGKASRDIRSHQKAFDSLAEKSDTAEQRFTGFSDSISGATEGLAAWNDESLSGTEKMMALGQAGADLAGGVTEFIIPALSSMTTLLRGGLASAMSFIAAHPLMIALIALAAIFVLLWTNSETFRNIVIGVFNAVGNALKSSFGAAIDWLVTSFNNVVGFFSQLPGRIGGFFKAIGDGITNAFKAAFNFVADIWNNTVGRLNFTIPSWVPVIGGNSFGVPKMPKFHTGVATVPGAPGTEMVATLQAGERVLTGSEASRGNSLYVSGDPNSWLFKVIKEGLKTGKLRLA
jgi:phage-related protein